MNKLRSSLAALLAAGVLAGCGSTIAGSAQPAGAPTQPGGTQGGTAQGTVTGPGTAPSGASQGAPAPGGAPDTAPATDAAGLAAKLQAGMQDVTSFKGRMKARAAGESIDARMEQTVENSKAKDAKMTMTISTMEMELLIVDGKTYLGGDSTLLSAMGVKETGKKYVAVSEDSSNAQLAAMAKQLKGSLEQSGPAGYLAFVASTTSVQPRGAQQVDGVPATQYDLVVDVAKLAQQVPNDQLDAATAAGLDTIPVSLWLDPKNRPIKVLQTIEVGGASVTVEFALSDYNEPVQITAPDPSEVAPGE